MPQPPADGSPPESKSRNDRETYRAVYPASYPVAATPHVFLEGAVRSVPIHDCSEQGIRFRAPLGAPEQPLGTPVSGELRTRDGSAHEIHGHIVRSEAGDVAIRLNPPGISFSVLLSEQRAVLLWTRTRADHD